MRLRTRCTKFCILCIFLLVTSHFIPTCSEQMVTPSLPRLTKMSLGLKFSTQELSVWSLRIEDTIRPDIQQISILQTIFHSKGANIFHIPTCKGIKGPISNVKITASELAPTSRPHRQILPLTRFLTILSQSGTSTSVVSHSISSFTSFSPLLSHLCLLPVTLLVLRRPICTQRARMGLEDFFEAGRDPEKDENLTYGRSWKASELRQKSWEDLHQLWYVLAKEKNMLLSQKQMLISQNYRMPNPERFPKVRKSMCRIKQVLTERALAEDGASRRRALREMINAM